MKMKMKMKKKNKVLVIAAHPDDEVLGCGGTIALHSAAGDTVSILLLSEGITSRDAKRDVNKNKKKLSELMSSAQKAAEILGTNSPLFENFPDNRMDTIDFLDIVKSIETQIEKQKPNIIYTHHAGDLNIDHRIVFKAVMTACRPFSSQKVEAIYSFETPSSTEWGCIGEMPHFVPTRFSDISNSYDIKNKALDAYKSEMRKFPHPRSKKAIKSLAEWRGSTCGVELAEAFIVVREIIKL